MIGDTTNTAAYAGNESTSTAYVIPFRYDAAGWVFVTVTDADGLITTLEQVTDYTLDGDGTTADGTFTTTAAIPDTSTVNVYREAPGLQSLDLVSNSPLPANSLEAQLDRLAMAAQDSVRERDMEQRIRDIELTPGPIGEVSTAALTVAIETRQPLNSNLTAYAADPEAAILENMLSPVALTFPPTDDADNLYITGPLFNGVVPVNIPTLYLDGTESLLTWKNEESLGSAADYSCYHDGDGNWTIFALNDSAWVSDGAWASPDLVETWIPLGDFTGAPSVIRDTLSGTAATALGQLCIVTALGGNTAPRIERDVFTCVQVLPVKWSPPGNLFKANNGIWYRQAILPGTTAIDFGLAYD